MKKSYCSALILIFSLLVIITSQAEDSAGVMTLDYLEGDMQIKFDRAWVNAETGDKLILKVPIKLSGDSIAEISGNRQTIPRNRNGRSRSESRGCFY